MSLRHIFWCRFPYNITFKKRCSMQCWKAAFYLLLPLYRIVNILMFLMFIGPCIIAIVDEWKTNLMSLATLFHFLSAQHVSDINISIFRSLRLCWWIITSVVLLSVRCVLELLLRLVYGGLRFAGFSMQNEHHQIPERQRDRHDDGKNHLPQFCKLGCKLPLFFYVCKT